MAYCLGYLSSAAPSFTPTMLPGIVASASANNAANDVTGMLCFFDNSFLQFLEGDEDDVRQTFQRIRKDSRHQGVIEVFGQSIAARAFASWSMALLTPEQLSTDQRRLCHDLRTLTLSGETTTPHIRELSSFLSAFQLWIR